MGLGKAAKRAVKWALPIYPLDLEKQVEKAMARKNVRQAYIDYLEKGGKPDNFKDGLATYIDLMNTKNKGMRRFAYALDGANKVTVPVDAVLDYFRIMGGIGSGFRAIKTFAFLPGYLAYDAYYAGKTGDIKGALGNLGYEALSWFSLGSLPHLFSKYVRQADSYAAKKGSEMFLNKIKGLEGKVVEFPKEAKKGETLEQAAEAA